MFLTADELVDLTDRSNPKYQAKWLAEHGYPFEISAAGKPKVLRTEVERRLSSTAQRQMKRAEPNWAALTT
mgnify:CR=1 FL=1